MTTALEYEMPGQDDPAIIAGAVFTCGTAFDGYTSQMRRVLSLNAHERLALAALWLRGPLTMTELGARIPLSRAAVTTLVDRLEASGLVLRRGDSSDRRRTVVEITDQAAVRTRPLIAPWIQDLHEIVQRRSPDEWVAITRFLADFRALNDHHTEQLAAMTDEQLFELGGAAAPSDTEA